jgi:hypothetical protein
VQRRGRGRPCGPIVAVLLHAPRVKRERESVRRELDTEQLVEHRRVILNSPVIIDTKKQRSTQ